MTRRATKGFWTVQTGAKCLIATLLVLATFPVGAQLSEIDPFHVCTNPDSGAGDDCIAPLDIWYAWKPTEPACRATGKKVDAIALADGQAKWTDLFRNERCARMGFSHGPIAAAAGSILNGEDPFLLCVHKNIFNDECIENMGRHSMYPIRVDLCEYYRDELTEAWAEDALSLEYHLLDIPFQNERCWRLGLPHFEPE